MSKESDEALVARQDAPATAGAPVEDERRYIAGQWKLMWWRFRRHKAAIASAIVVALFYLVAVFADTLSSADPGKSDEQFPTVPPQRLRFIDDGALRLHVYDLVGTRDLKTFRKVYEPDPDTRLRVRLIGDGYEYKLFGLFRVNKHLLVVEGHERRTAPFVLGTDEQGRDIFSRILHGTRLSLSIGLIGVVISLVLGILIGGASGYYGGKVDTAIQRLIELLRSIPTIPLWIGLAAALPREFTVQQRYLAITILLSLYAWTEIARVVRGRFLAMREEDFIAAARLSGSRDLTIIVRHMVPNFASHLIAAASLAIPFMIVSETSLSFLGLGLQAPAISWGVLLKAASNARTVASLPWLMLPAIPVIISVLAFNFMGDGLRDAADPYDRK
ncbi:MAG: ABC transporter permease [Spirochaetaceae bacterium]|nr:ABC transporter permease [Spirochaetaceae bacterium]